MPTPNAYRYTLIFPRVSDVPRPAWPPAVITRTLALPDVVDAYFPDLTASWAPAGPRRDDAVNVESRRRLVEILTASATPEAAAGAEAAIRAFALELLDLVGAKRATLIITPLADVEVLER